MGIDWMDDLLQQAEGTPRFSSFARQLCFAYELWRVDPPDPQPVREQEQTLGSLSTRAAQLRAAFNDSLIALRQSWTGRSAAAYLGPEATAFQGEYDAQPIRPGAGWRMWHALNQITGLLDYNEAAHRQAVDKLRRMRALHDELEADLKRAAGTLAAMLALPGAEPLKGAAEARELVAVSETANEYSQVGQAGVTVEQVAQKIGIGSSLLKSMAAQGTVAGVALLPLALASDAPASTVNPDIAYFSGVEGDQQQLSERALSFQTGDVLPAAAFARPGLSLEACQALIQRYGLSTVQRIANKLQAGDANTRADLDNASTIAGIEQMAQAPTGAGENADASSGAMYEVWWLANHATNTVLAQLATAGKNGKPEEGPDAQLEDGTLIQLRNYTWDQPLLNAVVYPQQIKEQVEITRRSYPGQPIKFVFNGCHGALPQAVLQTFEQLAEDGVTWEYWPPPDSDVCPQRG